MLTYNDQKEIRKIIKEEVQEIVQNEVSKQIEPLAINIDKVLKIVSDDRQEMSIVKAKVTHHEKRLKKIETKLNIKTPALLLF